MSFDATVDDYRRSFPKQNGAVNWLSVKDVVEAGLSLAEYLGIGGMGTRGFGRIRRLAAPIEVTPANSTNGIAETASPSPAEGGNGDGHSG
jgi:CRISPR-associated protein Cmr4